MEVKPQAAGVHRKAAPDRAPINSTVRAHHKRLSLPPKKDVRAVRSRTARRIPRAARMAFNLTG